MASAINVKPRLMAEPLHIQRLEAALNMRPFMEMARHALKQPLSSGSGEDSATELEPDQEPGMDSDDSSTRVGVVKLKAKQKRHKRLLGSKEGKFWSDLLQQ